jgi:hypothetical protein
LISWHQASSSGGFSTAKINIERYRASATWSESSAVDAGERSPVAGHSIIDALADYTDTVNTIAVPRNAARKQWSSTKV